MLKRFLLLAGLLSLAANPIMAAGTLPGISMTQQQDELGKPLSGGKLYLIQAGTTSTPQNCYQDTGLTIAWPNPVTLDAAGRIGQLFCADGSIKVRLTDKNGIQKLVQDNLLVVGPSGGGGGGGTVDPTTVLATGDFKLVYNTGVLTGFVRCNGRTIGSSTSGATERANADTSALFSFLWGADANLAVSGGRGASAAADYAANKTIALPDCRSRAIAGMSDMGASDSARITTTYFGCTGLVLGCAGGSETTTLTIAQIPPIISSGSNSIVVNAAGNSANNVPFSTATWNGDSYGGGVNTPLAHAFGTISYTNTFSGSNTINVTTTGTNGAAHRTVQPTILATIYIKL